MTTKARLYEKDLEKINKETEIGAFITNVAGFFIDKSSIIRNDRSCALHDPLVVSAVIDDSIIEFREEFVDIEYSSRLCDGQSISYYNRAGYTPNTKVAICHDDGKFKKMFLDSISE